MFRASAWLIVFSTFLPVNLLANATTTMSDPPIDILYGAYEILGRLPGPNGEVYRGWVRLAVESNRLEIDRCVNRQHNEGSGRLKLITADQKTAVEFNFLMRGQNYSATCVYVSDFDNLPRFTCYTYPSQQANIEVPGLESYFPIVWPVPIDFFDCD